ncbi:MAG: MATE family efflux transporter [Myxococcota bacterium]|nr:MATE family efflux transporter [Myxococcota bacterium]
MTALRLEIRKMIALGVPVAGAQLSTMLLGFVDTVMVGRVSVEAIGAAALANVWVFGTIMFANGVLFGLDPIVAQSHGAGDGERAGRALQTGLILSLLLSVPVALLWTQTERFLLLAGQDPELARMAHTYTLVQIPGVPFFLAYAALRQYLQGREHMRPALWVVLAANVFNAFFNWVLIFGNLGLPALGLLGAGIATSLTRLVSFVGLVLFVWAFRLHAEAWVPWSRESLSRARLREIVSIGLPVGAQFALEIWAFSGASLLAGLLGTVPLAAHTIALNMASLSFMMPLGISQGAATRVGNLVGAGDPEGAQRAAWVSVALGAGVMAVAAAAFVTLREWLPRIYTPEPDVVGACAAILPIAAAFQVLDGTQVVGGGILRGMGRTRPAMLFNLVGYWVLGLPIGAWLAFQRGFGLAGLWWGFAIGLGTVATLLVLFVHYRGPAVDRGRLVVAGSGPGA